MYQDQTTQRDLIVYLRGNADGTFGLPTTLPSTTSPSFVPSTNSSFIGEFTGDGRKDLLLTSIQLRSTGFGQVCLAIVSVIGSNLDPTIQESCASGLIGEFSGALLKVADVDRDGKLDALLAVHTPWHSPSVRLVVALGNGTGGFTFAPTSLPYGIAENDGISAVNPVDCNGDGNLDLVATFTLGTRPPQILYGNGAGDFTRDPPGLPLAASGCTVDCTHLPHVLPGAAVTCRNNQCAFPSNACEPHFAHCGDNANAGCETDVSTSRICGSCFLTFNLFCSSVTATESYQCYAPD
jgi:hypothetical protein